MAAGGGFGRSCLIPDGFGSVSAWSSCELVVHVVDDFLSDVVSWIDVPDSALVDDAADGVDADACRGDFCGAVVVEDDGVAVSSADLCGCVADGLEDLCEVCGVLLFDAVLSDVLLDLDADAEFAEALLCLKSFW